MDGPVQMAAENQFDLAVARYDFGEAVAPLYAKGIHVADTGGER